MPSKADSTCRSHRSHTSPPAEHNLRELEDFGHSEPSAAARDAVHAKAMRSAYAGPIKLRPEDVHGDINPAQQFHSMEVVSLHVQQRYQNVLPPAFFVDITALHQDRIPDFQTPIGFKACFPSPTVWNAKFDISTLEEAAILHICVKDWRAWSTVDSSDQYVLLRGEFPLKELLESAAASNDYTFPLYLQKPGGVEGHFILLRFHAVSSTVSYPLLRVRHMQSAEPVASSRWIAPNPTYRHSDGHSIQSFMTERDLSEVITSVSRPSAYGGHSDVYVGNMDGSPRAKKVAIKVMRTNTADQPKFHRRLRRELHVWMRLRHPNVLPLLGVYNGFGQDLGLVSPWCFNGDINSYLRTQCQSPTLTELRYRLLLQVLHGLEYLHSHTPSIVHADLKGANILICDLGEAQLCDFGMASMRDETNSATYASSSVGGTCRWMAPELFDSEKPSHSPASDVYSFGCVMLEVLTGHAPFHEESDPRVILNVTSGKRPSRPAETDDAAWSIMCDCWAADPSARPSVRKLEMRMDQLWCMAKPRLSPGLEDAELAETVDNDDAWSEEVQPAEDLDEDLDLAPASPVPEPKQRVDDRIHIVHYGWQRTESPEPIRERDEGADKRSKDCTPTFLPATTVTTIRYGKRWFATSTSPSEKWAPKQLDGGFLASRCSGDVPHHLELRMRDIEGMRRHTLLVVDPEDPDFALPVAPDWSVGQRIPLTFAA